MRPLGTLLRPKHHFLVTVLSGADLALHVAVAGVVLGLSRQWLHVVRPAWHVAHACASSFRMPHAMARLGQMDQICAHLVLGVSSIVWCAPMN